jgi:hypothetical protein
VKTTLTWKKRIFKNVYEIYSEDSLVGNLKENVWSQSADAELNGEEYHFRTKGFFILKKNTDNMIGKITYNSGMTKAKIEYPGGVYSWSYDNFWSTKWSLQNSEGPVIWYHRSSSEGIIKTEGLNNLLLLTGLYIHNYFLQATLVLMMVIFLPLIPVFFN